MMEVGNNIKNSPAPEVKGQGHPTDHVSFSASASASSSRTDLTYAGNDLRHVPATINIMSGRFPLPTLSRFLADFTLGFADGLTVPFALTAGLSSLGSTQTVIYAGMAEICAGSISMGIGGYLAAKGEQTAAAAVSGSSAVVDEEAGGDEEKEAALGSSRSSSAHVIEDYLAPLNLRGELRAAVEAHVRGQPDLVHALRIKAREEDDADAATAGFATRTTAPVMVGLSVSIGYLLGGLLPLFPYFFVSQVRDGLRWSFGVCLLALFLFGFTKHYLLHRDGDDEEGRGPWYHYRHLKEKKKAAAAQWKRVRESLWEGTQMVVLGSIAAVTAVLAVKALERLASKD